MTRADVSIVMLCHNGCSFTRLALEGLLRSTVFPAEIFLVDNASSDDTPALLSEFATRFQQAGIVFHTWRNAENVGCSRARNQAWEKATGKYTVFLDNDTVVCSPDWLEKMQRRFEDCPHLAILGPRLVYPYLPHPIQCAGVAFNRTGRVAFLGRGEPRRDPRFLGFHACTALISACWMMRTDLRDKIGMLDELFHPVQYEDLDLCARAVLAGYDVACDGDVEMFHFEGITTASFGENVYSINIARNSLKFRQRYHACFAGWDAGYPEETFRWKRRDELGLERDEAGALIVDL